MKFFMALLLFYIIGCVCALILTIIINNLVVRGILDDEWYTSNTDEFNFAILFSWMTVLFFFIVLMADFIKDNPDSIIAKVFFPKKH